MRVVRWMLRTLLKPALARGEIQCIGATTFDEFKKHIEKDGALVRRFQKVILKEPTMEETVEILKNLKESYEDIS
jgi:ATP-dependent Clp protease ATP-binding subunit ClpA